MLGLTIQLNLGTDFIVTGMVLSRSGLVVALVSARQSKDCQPVTLVKTRI